MCGNRKDPETAETLTVRSLPGTVRGAGGDADEQNGLLGLSACHRHLTTADVCPCCFVFVFLVEGEKVRAVSLLVGGRYPVQVQCCVAERFLQENTRATR